MAVTKLSPTDHSIEIYGGNNADSMPTTNVPAGSRFFEYDTGEEFIFDGVTTWTKRIFPAS